MKRSRSAGAELSALLDSIFGALFRADTAPRDFNTSLEAFLIETRSAVRKLLALRGRELASPTSESKLDLRIEDLREATIRVPNPVLGSGGRIPELQVQINSLIDELTHTVRCGRRLFTASRCLHRFAQGVVKGVPETTLSPLVCEILDIRAELSTLPTPAKFRKAYAELHMYAELLQARALPGSPPPFSFAGAPQ